MTQSLTSDFKLCLCAGVNSSTFSASHARKTIITEAAGGGAFLVLPIEKVGRVERDAPLVAGHKGSVLDIQWCPHNDDLIASGSEDCTVKVWQIPEGGLLPKTNLTTPVADLVCHQRRVGLVVWHPTAEHVLLSAGTDNMVYIWNVATEEPLVEISFPDIVLSACFNYNGSRLVTTCKDRRTRVLNPRTGSIIVDGICHQGSKPQEAVYIKDNRIFTTGFSPMSERQYALWKDEDISEPLHIQELDTSNGVLFPFYDSDTNLIYLCGKGDNPQRGMGWMPKRGLDVNQNEIARFYKLHAKGLCEVIPFTVPRKSELFQDDLYPDTIGDVPALTAEEWMSGKDADPVLVSLKEGYVPKSNRKSVLSPNPEVPQKTDLLDTQRQRSTKSTPPKDVPSSEQVNGVATGANHVNLVDVQHLMEDIRKMKIIIKGHERRIRNLEERLDLTDSGGDCVSSMSVSSIK
ncbi:unnamed protein product [Heterobilharzia americana]|nr:unnamed protein product [Heterobilharzia americana]